MASIDPVTTSVPLATESELPNDDAVTGTTITSQASAVTTSPDLSSLESMVADAQTQLASDPDGSSTLGKIVGILAGVVSALVSLVANIWGKQTTSAADTVSAQSKTTPTTSAATGGATTSSATGAGSTVAASSAASTSSTSGSTATQSAAIASSTVKQSNFEVIQNDNGAITIRTVDGYIVRADGKDYAWSITGPDGMTTRIWGDPHVSESDGGAWDFKKRGTFFFGKNKVTVEVVPYGNGQTVSSALNLYAGDERVTIKGIDANKPVIAAVSHDGKQHDDSLADGDAYSRAVNKTGEAWRTKNGLKTVTMG